MLRPSFVMTLMCWSTRGSSADWAMMYWAALLCSCQCAAPASCGAIPPGRLQSGVGTQGAVQGNTNVSPQEEWIP